MTKSVAFALPLSKLLVFERQFNASFGPAQNQDHFAIIRPSFYWQLCCCCTCFWKEILSKAFIYPLSIKTSVFH